MLLWTCTNDPMIRRQGIFDKWKDDMDRIFTGRLFGSEGAFHTVS